MKSRDELQCESCPHCSKSLFGNLCREDLAALYPHKTQRYYGRRELLFSQGTIPSGLFCLASGQVKVFQTGVDGRDQIVRLAAPGDPIGYRSLFAGEPYSASAEALGETTACFIGRDSVLGLLRDKPVFMQKLLVWLCQDLRQAEERLKSFLQKPVRERLAETLVVLAKVFGRSVDTDIRLEIRLTRQEIAELAGMVLETAVRCLSVFKREKLLRTEGRVLILTNLQAMVRTARLEDC